MRAKDTRKTITYFGCAVPLHDTAVALEFSSQKLIAGVHNGKRGQVVIQRQNIIRQITALNACVVPRWMLGRARECKCHCEEDRQHEIAQHGACCEACCGTHSYKLAKKRKLQDHKMMVGIVLGMIVTRPTMAVPHKS